MCFTQLCTDRFFPQFFFPHIVPLAYINLVDDHPQQQYRCHCKSSLELPHTQPNTQPNAPIHHQKKICTAGRGILAADESTGTIGSRFTAINVENTQDNRREYRKLLFTAPGLENSISGAILFEETLFDKDAETGEPLIKPLQDKGIVIGIKVDKGTKNIPFCDNETYTQGLTDLDVRCKQYYAAGARFAKWRAVIRISRGTPTDAAIKENAETLAKYAAICQMNGLVPIVEPEILMDGDHSLAIGQYWTTKVIAECYYQLNKYHVILEGTLLKPNMVAPGQDCPDRPTPAQVAVATLTALSRSVPPAMPGVVFLSGGQSEEEATVHLNEINKLKGVAHPWSLTFSYGRALQKTCLDVWKGKKENFEAAQKALIIRANANGAAQKGEYKGEAATKEATESLYVSNYKY